MRSNQSRPSTLAVILSTIFFVAATLTLGALATNVVVTMRASADLRDDDRAMRAAEAALQSLKDKLSSTVQNNAERDEAYDKAQGADLARWAYLNWGAVGADYPLYDGVVVVSADRRIVTATLKTEDMDPSARFGSGFRRQVAQAAKPTYRPVVNFVRTPFGVSLMASQAIQPHTHPAFAGPHAILTFFKDVHTTDLLSLEKQYQLTSLRLFTDTPPSDLLTVPLKDIGGRVIGYLGWKSLKAGTRVYEEVSGQITAAVGILAIFILTVVLSGGFESRRLTKLARQAGYEASHDSLSGLLNRSGLLSALSDELAAGGDVVLHMVDLDGFKGVNDSWGHQIGDGLIRKISEALPKAHPQIIHAARLGGDEFALVQRGDADFPAFSDAILSTFSGVFDVEGRTVEVGASVGSARSDGLTDPFEILRRADMALYRAKDDGKGRGVAYHPELDRERERLAALEDELRTALDSGWVTVMYQPLVSAKSGQVNGVEALARWNTDRGPISPEVFIPLAERSGLIDVLGMHVLRQSVRSALGWPGLKLSVNVSPIQLCNPSFASSVSRLLDEEGFDPKLLTLEITEGVLMTNPEQAQRAIDDLRKTGVRFSLDDFGCGYASIGALRQFGFDSMKIDRSLVWAADTDGHGQDVLRATIALATALSIPVTAEGIETAQQADLLRDAGCDQLQGYMVGRPMLAEDIGRLASHVVVAA
jgi:diguanylate cyclase (GGDEF)-like protein